MKGKNNTREQNIDALFKLRRRISELETSERELKSTAKKLLESEEKLRSIFNLSPDAITITDSNEIIVECNQATLDLHGYSSRQEVIGRSAFELIAKKERDRAMKKMKKAFESDSMKNAEHSFLRKDGNEFPAELFTSVWRDSSGRAAGFVTITKDITKYKQLEERLKQNQKMLDASQRELKSLLPRILSIREEEKKNLSNILHGEVGAMAVALSSCLTGIEELIKNNNLRAALETSARTKSELDEFVSKLKKIAADLRPPDLDAIGLTASLREYFSDVKKCADIKINFRADIDEKRIDSKMAIVLYRVIQEALNNIIRHAGANTVEINIFSRAKKIKLDIGDDGKGFDIERSKKGTGTHLGIAGMKEATESIKGTFNIKSVRGKGTKISVTIPLS